MARSNENRGPVVYTHDALASVNVTLKEAVFQTEPRGAALPIAPEAWADPLGQLRSVLTKEADLVRLIAGALQSWAEDHRREVEVVALVQPAADQLRIVERSLLETSKNVAAARALLDSSQGA